MNLFDESVLLALAANAAARQEFPFLTLPTTPVSPCCGGRPGQQPQPDFNAMKAAIVSLSPERKKRLLELAGLKQGRVVYYDGGRVADVTIG